MCVGKVNYVRRFHRPFIRNGEIKEQTPIIQQVQVYKEKVKISLKINCLFLILILILVGDVEVTELIGTLVRGNDTEPVTELVLLEELLGKVLEVTLGELLVGSDGDLGIITTDNGHLIGETTGATLDLDAIVKELLLYIQIVASFQ